jgi:ATP-dependent Clp protease, protease subunit
MTPSAADPNPIRPVSPSFPWPPGSPPGPATPGRPAGPQPGLPGARVWTDPSPWPGRVYERLFEQRIVIAHGQLDGEAATSLCAQLLTLDAERNEPIRLELQGLAAGLDDALTVMGVVDVLRVPLRAYAGGRIEGPALGVLAAAPERHAYPNAVFVLSEPRLDFEGTATELASHEEQVAGQLDALYMRLAEATGREVDEIRADTRRGRHLTADEAVAYGLVQGQAASR